MKSDEKFPTESFPGLCFLSETSPGELAKTGVVEGSKTYAQALMLELGLPIPEGVTISSEAFDLEGNWIPETREKLEAWIRGNSGRQFQIRGDVKTTVRNKIHLSSLRNQPTSQALEAGDVLEELQKTYFDLTTNPSMESTVALVQHYPPNGLDRDEHSAQAVYDPTSGKVLIEIRHDIATGLARENQSPDETIIIPISSLLDTPAETLVQELEKYRTFLSPEGMKKSFIHTLQRFGRNQVRVIKPSFPRIHQISEEKPPLEYLNRHELESLMDVIEGGIPEVKGDLATLGLPQSKSEIKTTRELLAILGLINLNKEEDPLHTMHERLMKMRAGEGIYGYFSPSQDNYAQLIIHMQYLAKKEVLQSGLMPKLSIVRTQEGIEFIYWDLIPSYMEAPNKIRKLTGRFDEIAETDENGPITHKIKDNKTGQIIEKDDVDKLQLDTPHKNWLKDYLKEGD